MSGLCLCGCGGATTIADKTNRREGWVAGEPKRFIVGHNARLIRTDPAERFWSFVERGAPDACWEWMGYRDAAGYGRFTMGRVGTGMPAHRAALILGGANLTSDLFACHHCDNPPCVNPAHLFVGTHLDNMRDMRAKGRARSGIRQTERTTCPSGHPYDAANTAVRNGRRHCRACDRARAKRNYDKARLVKAGGGSDV